MRGRCNTSGASDQKETEHNTSSAKTLELNKRK